MRVLIACESSGIVREAFRARGHVAMSCDMKPSEQEGMHYQGDVRDVIHACWDLMVAHPPCTHLSVSGAAYFEQKIIDGRQQSAASFFMELARADIPLIAIENPVCIMSSVWREPDQIVQPYQFGHDASKATCLWLKGLPPLKPTKFIEPRYVDGKPRWSNQTDSGQNKLPPSDERATERSRTYQGIAEAMAEQWTAWVSRSSELFAA